MKTFRKWVSWLITLWMCYVFLGSLPYKFTQHPDTQHIFGTIGTWLGGFLGEGVGGLFSTVGAYAVGGFELLTSLVLLAPALLWLVTRARGEHFPTPAGNDGMRWVD